MSKRVRKKLMRTSESVRQSRGAGARDQPSPIDLADALEKRCTQAVALASLLMETDADDAVADTAWVLRDLVEEIRVTGRTLHQSLPMTK
jgi:hypothetical protein